MSTIGVIGIVGLGLVGSAIAKRLAAAGHAVHGYDLREEARTAFANAGHKVVSSISDLAQHASCVILAVFETKDVITVIEGEGGLLAGGGSLKVIVDCSTGEPTALQALALRLAAKGVDFIEAPLSGSSQQIESGESTMLLGGDVVAIQRCEPLLNAITDKRIHVGAAGMGANAKLATNLVLGLNRAVLAEGMVFAELLGIEPAKFLELVLKTPAHSGAAIAKGQMMVDGNFAPQSRIRQHSKDVKIMLDVAALLGQKLPLSKTHADLMQRAIDSGDGDLDNAAIIRQIQREK